MRVDVDVIIDTTRGCVAFMGGFTVLREVDAYTPEVTEQIPGGTQDMIVFEWDLNLGNWPRATIALAIIFPLLTTRSFSDRFLKGMSVVETKDGIKLLTKSSAMAFSQAARAPTTLTRFLGSDSSNSAAFSAGAT
jgi:hypothetical protein